MRAHTQLVAVQRPSVAGADWRIGRGAAWAVICWVIAGLRLPGCGASIPDNAYQSPPPPEVTVVLPLQATVTQFIEENGETEVVERAEVRARVRGFLNEIKFQPGQHVAAGDVLYEIQHEEYAAAVNSAQAALDASSAAIEVAESQLGVANVELTRADKEFVRYEGLLKEDATTKKQFDQSKADLDSAKASVAVAEATVEAAKADRGRADASLEQARLDLGYTTVTAPISGHITKTEIKVGNLVENGDLMATIVNNEEIFANFSVSDRDILRLQQAMPPKPEGEESADGRFRGWPVQMRRELDDGFPFQGGLDYIDREGVDQATGTFSMRAVFENPDDLIFPGLFVRVRVPIGRLEGALLIPQQALLRDQQGAYALVVDGENKVERKVVTAGQQVGGMVVIEDGLASDDRVLLRGMQRARPGATVSPVEEELAMPEELENQPALPEDWVSPPANQATADDGADEQQQ